MSSSVTDLLPRKGRREWSLLNSAASFSSSLLLTLSFFYLYFFSLSKYFNIEYFFVNWLYHSFEDFI